MRLKNHESPRKIGRNRKGKGGSAKARQYRKRQKMLSRKMKAKPLKKKRYMLAHIIQLHEREQVGLVRNGLSLLKLCIYHTQNLTGQNPTI